MKVYRIESENGIGPYQNGARDKIPKLYSHTGCPNHPCPWNDGISNIDFDNEYCGFSSIEQLNKWFHGFKAPLRRLGYKMAVYEVEEKFVNSGTRQLVFNKSESKLTKKIQIPWKEIMTPTHNPVKLFGMYGRNAKGGYFVRPPMSGSRGVVGEIIDVMPNRAVAVYSPTDITGAIRNPVSRSEMKRRRKQERLAKRGNWDRSYSPFKIGWYWKDSCGLFR
jgi:hypothetical protein